MGVTGRGDHSRRLPGESTEPFGMGREYWPEPRALSLWSKLCLLAFMGFHLGFPITAAARQTGGVCPPQNGSQRE